jgi:DNA-binding NarL/FixJ family response regulator
LDTEDLARQAVQLGAQDYLLRDHLDRHVLPRALRAIIERKAVEAASQCRCGTHLELELTESALMPRQ